MSANGDPGPLPKPNAARLIVCLVREQIGECPPADALRAAQRLLGGQHAEVVLERAHNRPDDRNRFNAASRLARRHPAEERSGRQRPLRRRPGRRRGERGRRRDLRGRAVRGGREEARGERQR